MYSQQQVKTKINNPNLNDVISQAKLILHEYDLCEYCIGRLFAKQLGLSQHQLLGKKIHKSLKIKPKKKCYICKNLFFNLQKYLEIMCKASSGYEFKTFLIGTVLKPSMVDNDDIVRSKFKLKGIDSIKTELTHQLGKKFSKKSKKYLENLSPELTFIINFKNDACQVITKPLCFQGKYIKKNRGISQKQFPCSNCQGKGCNQCDHHGISEFNSVEGTIANFLFQKFGGTRTKISWIGGEDKSSLVLGNGRPFFVKLLNPKKRNPKKLNNYTQKGVTISNLKIIELIPKSTLRFVSLVKITVVTEEKISSKELRKLNELKKSTIIIDEKPKKHNEKFIHDLNFKKLSAKSFILSLNIDGGVPIKRFVEGNNVNPNLTDLLTKQCKCTKFDFHSVSLIK